MSKTYTINVTQEDIDLGKPYDVGSCPIARAATRALQNAKRSWWQRGPFKPKGGSAFVGINDFVYARSHDILVTDIPLPPVARKFVRNFDSYNDRSLHKPFSFKVEI